jgi:phage baseplate assembly protein W
MSIQETLTDIQSNRKVYYLDFTKDGRDYIGNKDIAMITNNQAILESIKNIILTEPGDNIFDPHFGCPIYHYLFEPLDYITSLSIQKAIYDAIKINEPRVDNINIFVDPDEANNTYNITITFDTHYSVELVSLKMNLNKIR